jgi:hypothetical protein
MLVVKYTELSTACLFRVAELNQMDLHRFIKESSLMSRSMLSTLTEVFLACASAVVLKILMSVSFT